VTDNGPLIQDAPSLTDIHEEQTSALVLRESNLPEEFPLKDTSVDFPIPEKNFAKTIMYYMIKFSWNGDKKTIKRRFSEIDLYRNAIRALLPYSYVFPLHRKPVINNQDEPFLIDRTQEIATFFKYVESRSKIFNNNAVYDFFQPQVEKEMEKTLSSYKSIPLQEILLRYRTLFPDLKSELTLTEIRAKVMDFATRIPVNVNFYNKIKESAENMYVKVFTEDNLKNKEGFYELVTISVSQNKEKYRKIREHEERLFKNYNEQDWVILTQKLTMLVEELKAFDDMMSNVGNLEKRYRSKLEEQEKVKKEISEVLESPNQKFGFFKKINKEEKMEKLREKEKKLASDVELCEELLRVVYLAILEHEVPLMKKIKNNRYNTTLKNFCAAHIQMLENELNLWKSIQEIPMNIEEDESARRSDIPKEANAEE